jgi:hypothetical protein
MLYLRKSHGSQREIRQGRLLLVSTWESDKHSGPGWPRATAEVRTIMWTWMKIAEQREPLGHFLKQLPHLFSSYDTCPLSFLFTKGWRAGCEQQVPRVFGNYTTHSFLPCWNSFTQQLPPSHMNTWAVHRMFWNAPAQYPGGEDTAIFPWFMFNMDV